MGNIVVTGMGIKAPGVTDVENFLNVLKNNECKLSVIRSNEVESVLGIVDEDFNTTEFEGYNRTPRLAKISMAAAKEAALNAKITDYPSHRIGVILGSAAGLITEIAEQADLFTEIKTTPLHGVTLADAQTLTNSICEFLGITGTALTISTGCTASIDALLVAKQLIEADILDLCIVGGADSPLNDWTVNGFKKIRSLSKETQVEKAGIPFSTNYKGFTMSEGAAFIVIEDEKKAKLRNKKIYGKIKNIVSKNEGLKMLRSDVTGSHMTEVFQQTMKDTEPTYINSQALGMEINDRIEAKLATEALCKQIPITSIKGTIGHTFGAMGAMQLISSILSINHQFIPATIKTDKKGFEEVPIVTKIQYQKITSVAITTHSSSGNNACALVTV